MFKPFFLTVVLFFFNFFVFSQNFQKSFVKKTADKATLTALSTSEKFFKTTFNKAIGYVASDNYLDALYFFSQLDSLQPNNSNIQFYLGICYSNIPGQKGKAIPFFEKARKNISIDYSGYFNDTTASIYTYYFLAIAKHAEYDFDEAIDLFLRFKVFLVANDFSIESIEDVERRIEMCYTAKKLTKNPVFITVDNLGKTINSVYSEYCPLLSADGQTLIFTSRRPNEYKINKDFDGQYFEDIYITTKYKNGEWTEPKPISKNINTAGHEASVGISSDGKTLLIYKDDGGGDGNIYFSKKKSMFYVGSQWTIPKKLGKNVNSKYAETHACITADGNTLYFVSDRPNGYGGKDIYKSEKTITGQWGVAENLGPTVNSPYDEESPFISADEKTLYFSSQGHESMGGYDIFYSTVTQGGFGSTPGKIFWSYPKNMGYPINSTEDDLFYYPTNDKKQALYASSKDGGLGGQDVYVVTIRKEMKQMIALKGSILDNTSNQPINARIEIVDNTKKEVVASFISNTGIYLVSLPINRIYSIRINANNYKEYNETFDLSKQINSEINKIIKLSKMGSL